MSSFLRWGWDYERWESARKRGEILYVIKEGVLLFGGSLFTFNLICDLLAHRRVWPSAIFQLLWWMVAGAFMGDWNWNANERRFLKEKAQKAVRSDL